MAKEFNPDQFLQQTAIIAEDQAEIEKRNQAPAAQTPDATAGTSAPGMLDQAGNFITQTAIPTAYGLGAAAADVAASHPYLTAGAAAMLPESVLSKIPGGQKILAGKEFFSNLGNAAQAYAQKEARLQQRPGFGGAPSAGPVAPQPAPMAPQPAPVAQPVAAQQPSMMQRGMDYANRMRQAAAQRVVGFGASGAAVPAAVGVGGAAATGLAGGQMRAMTPEQRRGFYDNPMLGAMGGDAGLAAAIMNRGQ